MSKSLKTVRQKYEVLSALKDEVLVYHVTYANRLESIAKQGLTPNASRSIGSPGYDSHAKGKVFVTDFGGVRFWMSRAEDFANHNSDHPLTDLYVPVVLSTSKVPKEDLEEDELGTRDAANQAWFLTKKIPARNLEIWDGHEWTSLSDYDSIDFSKAFDIEEPEEDEGDEPLEYFKAESPFLPREE